MISVSRQGGPVRVVPHEPGMKSMFTEEFRDLANRLIATKLTERQEELQEDIE